MKKKLIILGIVSLIVSCKTTTLPVSQVQTHKNISITEEYNEAEDFTKVIAPYKEKLDGAMNSKISFTEVDLTKQGNNSNLGNLLADFTLEGAKVWAKNHLKKDIDAAVINIGGIRSNINKGEITVRNVFEVMPFENEVVVVKMKGSDIKNLFDYYEMYQKNNPVSQLYIETENNKLVKNLINGKTIDVTRDYYIATSDYLAMGGDNMKFFEKGEMISTGIKMRELFLESFKKNPIIKTSSDIRLKFNGVQ